MLNVNIIEEWKPVYGYESQYQVSNTGKCRSLDRKVSCGQGVRISRGKSLKPDISKNGYLVFTLCKDGKKNRVFAHRLVANHFIPNPQKKDQVNHKDFDKRNNLISNLEWVSDIENKVHAFENGMHSCAKLTPKDVRLIRNDLDSGLTQSEISEKHLISQPVVSRIKTRSYWSHVE